MSAAGQLEPTLSPEDVAQLTGLHYQSVLAEVRSGALRARKIRGRYLITVAAYEAWLTPDDVDEPPPRVPATPSPPKPVRRQAAGSLASLQAIDGGLRGGRRA